ncbi:mediator of RNA polymerase II transcription subunit 21-like isoform X1 [Xenia sp. Carnegie-2017]|uniref:mediator of RNA polymerase II transcription subunit 21-like isoform X1 n=1 Tax=Xenia sp. Carnegie-2017 TaxID=2897299 RepID=UPI001F03FEBF|nr:mediator of RNA polymerase II transcription subunit 21-like isoform X1 [Xenia sp. Carnegie-2017]
MADRVSQLQDALNELAEHFCNSIGTLQQTAQPSSFPGFEKEENDLNQEKSLTQEGHAKLFASMIARTAKDIDCLIDSLPSDECSTELQMASLERLQMENEEAGMKLQKAVEKGEAVLEMLQNALKFIAEKQLDSECDVLE